MAAAVVVFHVEVLGVEVGHWCNACMRSSAIRVWYVTRTGLAMTLRQGAACADRECDSRDVELTEQPTTIWQS